MDQRLNVRPGTMRLVEENIYKILPNRDIDEDFLNGIPIRQEIILRVAKWDCMKLRHFCTENNTITIQEVACRMCVCVWWGECCGASTSSSCYYLVYVKYCKDNTKPHNIGSQ